MKFVSHNGKMLTHEEVGLSEIYERREAVKRAAEAEALAERKMLSHSTAALNRPSIITSSKMHTDKNIEESPNNSEENDGPISLLGNGNEVTTSHSDTMLDNEPAGVLPDSEGGVYVDTKQEEISNGKKQQQTHQQSSSQYKKNDDNVDADDDMQVVGSAPRSTVRDEDIEGEAIRNDFADPSVSIGNARRMDHQSSTSGATLKKARITTEHDDDDEIIVDLDTLDARALYASGFLTHDEWDPSIATHNKVHILDNFGMVTSDSSDNNKNMKSSNTLVLQLEIPDKPKRWSVEICPSEHHSSYKFLHFNPRYNKHEIIMNNKMGFWGAGRKVYMRKDTAGKSQNRGTTALMSRQVELMISIRETGFAIFANGQCCAFFPHRSDLTKLSTLSAVLPRTDDNGVVETITFKKVWWGYRDPNKDEIPGSIYTPTIADEVEAFQEKLRQDHANETANGNANSGTGEGTAEPASSSSNTSIVARTLEITGLPIHTIDKEILELEKLLYEIFQDYTPEDIHVNLGTDSGYVRLPTVDACLDALDAMQGVGFEGDDGTEYFLDLSRFKKTF